MIKKESGLVIYYDFDGGDISEKTGNFRKDVDRSDFELDFKGNIEFINDRNNKSYSAVNFKRNYT